jgi:hypothetical protein
MTVAVAQRETQIGFRALIPFMAIWVSEDCPSPFVAARVGPQTFYNNNQYWSRRLPDNVPDLRLKTGGGAWRCWVDGSWFAGF